jgi:predicted nuclease of predicted toxin-antitoxin system
VIRLLLDQGLPRSTVLKLRERGWDVVHVGEIGLSRATDEEILQRGRIDGRVVVTLDADFQRILVLSAQKEPSVVRVRIEGLDGEALAALIESIRPKIESAVRDGALVSVTRGAVRIRHLPLGRRPSS